MNLIHAMFKAILIELNISTMQIRYDLEKKRKEI